MGKIKIDDYSESIYIPVDFWSIEDYKKQWTEGLQRLKTHDKSCLVVTIHDPNIRPFIDMWVMYKIDDMVYVQNKRYMSEVYDGKNEDCNFRSVLIIFHHIGNIKSYLAQS